VTLCLEDSNRSLGHVAVKVTVGLVASLCCICLDSSLEFILHTPNKVNTNLSNSLCAIGILGTQEGLEKGVLEMCYKCYTYKPYTTIEPE
jgi:hypothetical protein